jgi:drug/metabolite transporter (DMT)-like permease
VPFLRERISGTQVAALALLASAVVLSGFPPKWVGGTGLGMAFAATVLWAVENIIAKVALRELPSIIVAWARMTLGSVILVGFLVLTGRLPSLLPSTLPQAFWAFATGVILFGYVAMWYAALKHASAVSVTAILVLAAPITAMLESAFVTHRAPPAFLLPAALIVFGVFLTSHYLEHFLAVIRTRFGSVRSSS